jgi:hypothetical protein
MNSNGILVDSGALRLTEQAAAVTDVAGIGQLWVKDDAPNTLWFTDDAGNDVQLGAGVYATQYKYKTADESATNDDTYSNDTHLAGFTLEAGAYYRIDAFIHVVSASLTPDLKYQLVFSNTPQRGSKKRSNTSGTSEATTTTAIDLAETGIQIALGADANALEISGYFQANASTGGTLTLQWAQNTSNGNATTLKQGSWMSITKIS